MLWFQRATGACPPTDVPIYPGSQSLHASFEHWEKWPNYWVSLVTGKALGILGKGKASNSPAPGMGRNPWHRSHRVGLGLGHVTGSPILCPKSHVIRAMCSLFPIWLRGLVSTIRSPLLQFSVVIRKFLSFNHRRAGLDPLVLCLGPLKILSLRARTLAHPFWGTTHGRIAHLWLMTLDSRAHKATCLCFWFPGAVQV